LNGRQVLSVTIQRATISDLEALYQIERECFTTEAFSKQDLTYLLESSNAVSLVAQINNTIAGFVIGSVHLHHKKITGRVYTLDVAVKYRRKGVGLKLLDEIERIFVKRGAKICYLEARKDNLAALKLYRNHGYAGIEELEDYYNGVHGVRLEKKLAV
jgi:ribosomal-protein-alanine N-acetyltransferase